MLCKSSLSITIMPFLLALTILPTMLISSPVLALSGSAVQFKKPENVTREEYFNEYLSYFPPKLNYKKKFVIIPPAIPDDERNNHLLEIQMGKRSVMQPCGESKFHNTFQPGFFEGLWQRKSTRTFSYLSADFGEMERSILFCSLPRKVRFVEGKGVTFPLEKDLPIVLYVPPDAKVQYRFWTAPGELHEALPNRRRYVIKD